MQSHLEFQCKMALAAEGVPNDLVQQWYESIFLEPNADAALTELCQHILDISDDQIMDLLVLYGEEGGKVAFREMVNFFARCYGINRDLDIVESSEGDSAMCVISYEDRCVTGLLVYVNPRVYAADGAALLVMAAHEVWHAHQTDMVERWLRELCGTRMDFDTNPKSVRPEMLYYLNQKNYIRYEKSMEMYTKQLVEHEAYFASSLMLDRLQRFSRKVFERAIASLRMSSRRI